MIKKRKKYSLIAIVALGIIFCSSRILYAENNNDIKAFEQLSLEKFKRAQIKLTYLGPQHRPIHTLLFLTDEHSADLSAFVPYRSLKGEGAYGNDEQGFVKKITVSPEELRDTVQAFKHAFVRFENRRETEAFLSFAILYSGMEKTMAFEEILTPKDAAEFFIYVRGALAMNLEAQRQLQSWGCALGLLPEEIPAKDVSAVVEVKTSGVRWNEQSRHFECTATLTNISNESFYEPISLVVDTANNWNIDFYNGTTCVTKPVGRRYVHVKVPGGGLAPKASVETVLIFEGPDDEPIQFTTKVLAGSGER